jgi:hypothetical protein
VVPETGCNFRFAFHLPKNVKKYNVAGLKLTATPKRLFLKQFNEYMLLVLQA